MKRLSDALEERMQFHIGFEENSSRIYRDMAEWLEYNGWFNASKLYHKYADEEMVHAKKFYGFLQDRDCMPKTPTVEAQPGKYTSIEDIAKKSYEHEIAVSNELTKTASMAIKEGCITSLTFVQWFINEQIEEEAKTKQVLDRIDMLKETNAPLYHLEELFEDMLED